MSAEKYDVYQLLSQKKQIFLPEILNPVKKGYAYDALQKEALIEFDSIRFIESESSMIDFIVTKGNYDILITLSYSWLKLTDEQRQRIESTGKPYLILRGDLTTDWHSTIVYGCNRMKVNLQPFGEADYSIQTTYWVYHNKWGWQNGAQ